MGNFSYYLTLGTACLALVGATSAAVQLGDAQLQAAGVMPAAPAAAHATATPGAPAADAPVNPPTRRARPRYRTVRGF